MSSEAALIDEARRGSTAAFTDLVGQYRQGLLRFLLTRSASYADAEDALQETLINAYRYLESYDSRWRFSTWLYRIAVNNAMRLRRTDTVELGEVPDSESDPLAQCIVASERENLWLMAKRLLSDEAYTAMWLRYVEDMSVRDIASVLDRTVSWTKVNLSRGRKILEQAMNTKATEQSGETYGQTRQTTA